MENALFQHKLLHAIATFDIFGWAINEDSGLQEWHQEISNRNIAQARDRTKILEATLAPLVPDSKEYTACSAAYAEALNKWTKVLEESKLSDEWPGQDFDNKMFGLASCAQMLFRDELTDEAERVDKAHLAYIRNPRPDEKRERKTEYLIDQAIECAMMFIAKCVGDDIAPMAVEVVKNHVLAGGSPRRALEKGHYAVMLEIIKRDENISQAVSEIVVSNLPFNQSFCVESLFIALEARKDFLADLLTPCRALLLWSIWDSSLNHTIEHHNRFRQLVEESKLDDLFVTHLQPKDVELPFSDPLTRLCLSYCDPPPRKIFLTRLAEFTSKLLNQ